MNSPDLIVNASNFQVFFVFIITLIWNGYIVMQRELIQTSFKESLKNKYLLRNLESIFQNDSDILFPIFAIFKSQLDILKKLKVNFRCSI